MLRQLRVLFILACFMLSVESAQAAYSIKEMTPQVKQALDARKERFSQLRSLKSSGIIGENNRGYVEVLQDDASASSLVASENEDRKTIYETIAQQNGLQGALSTIESAFAQVQKENAQAGDKIQSADGRWTIK